MTVLVRSLKLDEGPERAWPAVLAVCRGRMTLEQVDTDARVVKGHTLPNAVSRLRLGVEVALVCTEDHWLVRAAIEEIGHRRFAATAKVWWEGVMAGIERELHPFPAPPEPDPSPLRAWAVSGAGMLVGLGVATGGVAVSLHSPSVVSVAVSAVAAVLTAESVKSLIRDRGRRPPFAGAPSQERGDG